MSDALTAAINQTDLPALVATLWPESGAVPGKPGLYRAAWRGDKSPSLSLFRKNNNGVWLWRDFSTGQSGNALHLLQYAAGMSPAEAANYLKTRTVQVPAPPPYLPPAPRQALQSGLTSQQTRFLRAAQSRLTQQSIARRGITLQQARQVGLGESDLGLIIPIPGPDGQIQAIKYRLRALSQKGERYRYLTPGRGTPAWFSQFYGTEQQRPVLVVEGELNGIATWFALEDWDVVGIAGVTGEVPVQHLQGRQIYLLADDDEAGRGWVNRWKETLGATGLPPLPGQMDACEYATEYGPAALRRVILAAAGI